ncbi:MAG: hypothetical protein ACOX6T_12355 [Myxococcales bacterium]|jgi:aminopeptidase N
MLSPTAAALLVYLAAAPATSAGPSDRPAPDPEIEVVATSLLPGQRAAVEKAVGGLQSLPRYRLDLALDTEQHRISGRVQVVLSTGHAAGEVFFRIPANAPFLDSEDGPAVTIVKVTCDGKPAQASALGDGTLRVDLPQPPAEGAPAVVELEISARIPDVSNLGLRSDEQLMQQAFAFMAGAAAAMEQRTDHGVFGRAGTAYNLAGFFPELVRFEAGAPDVTPEPGKGEPSWGPLANYTVSLVAPPDFQIAGTGTEIGQTPEKDGRRRSTRVAAAVRGFALFAGRGFQEQKATAGKVRVRVLAPEGQGEQPRKLLDVAKRSILCFSERFGPYPWADLELASAPLHGGVEGLAYPGFIFASTMLTDPGLATSMAMFVPDARKVNDSVLEMVVAHQVSHQWWRGIVGSNNRERPVLDEPLATYSAVLYVEKRRGKKAANELLRTQVRDAYNIYRMLGGSDASVDRPIGDYGGRSEIVGLLNGKGALYYDRLRKLVGDKLFFGALRRHYKDNYFREISSDGVLLATAAVAPAKAQAALELYERYMRQIHGDEDVGGPRSFADALQQSGMQVDPATKALLDQLGAAFGGALPVAPPPPPPSGTGP